MHGRTLLLTVVTLLTGLAASSSAAAATYVLRYFVNNAGVTETIINAGGNVVANHPAIRVIIADADNLGFAAAVLTNPNFARVTRDQFVQWVPNSEELLAGKTASLSGFVPSPATANPTDAVFYPFQWNLPITKTDLAWGTTLGNPNVKVAVLDTGVCEHHIDTAGRVDPAPYSANFVPSGSECPCPFGTCQPWDDLHFHGTHTAATISSNNIGTAGIAPYVRLRAVKVLNCTGSGLFSWIINGLMHAADTGNDVINMSLGAYFPKNLPGAGDLVAALNEAVNYANSRGALVVTPATNSAIDLDRDRNGTSVPCQSGAALCVGATTSTDELADYSNHGLSGPKIVAPGGGNPSLALKNLILGPCSPHSVVLPCGSGTAYVGLEGTSLGAAHASGAAALVDSVHPRGPGAATASQLRDQVVRSAEDLGKKGADNTYSHGRLNTFDAVQGVFIP